MKTLFLLIAIAAVALANPLSEQNYGEEEVAKISVGIRCKGKHCSVSIGGSWFQADDGSLVPIFEPVPAGGKVEVGAECSGGKCGGSVKVGVDWFKSEDGRLVAVPSANKQYGSELSCNAGHCIGKFQVSKYSQTPLSEGSGPQETKEIIVDWFKAQDGSLVGVPRTEVAKGHNDEDSFVAGDGAIIQVPQFSVAQPAGTIEVGAKYNGNQYSGNTGVRINWFEDADGNLVPDVVPQPAKGHVTVGAECHGSRCGGSVNVKVDWYVAPNGVVILTPKLAKTHITGGISCHGRKCSGNIGVGVDWFKDENNNVVSILLPIPRSQYEETYRGISLIKPKSYGSEEDSLDSYRGNIPIIPVIPNVPRLVNPKSYSAQESTSYAKTIILEKGQRDPKRPVEVIIDSECKGIQIKGLKCSKVTVDLRFYRLPNGEIIPQVIEDEEIAENVSVSQISPTTARFKVRVGGKIHCKGLKCKGSVNVGISNRKRRDLGEGFIQEIYRAKLIYYKKEGENEPFDLIFEFPQSF